MALVEIKVPDIGDFEEVAVIELLVQAGDTIKPEQSLLTVESDKASMEIPSSDGGVVKELRVKLGDKVKQGTVIAVVESAAAAAAGASAPPQAERRVAEAPASTAAAASPAPPQPSPGGGASESIEIRVPDIGDFKDVAVIEVLVKVGDTVKVEQSLLTVESDKASMEIPSASAGVVKELRAKIGDKLNVGDVIAVLQGAAGAASPAPQPSSQAQSAGPGRFPRARSFARPGGREPR